MASIDPASKPSCAPPIVERCARLYAEAGCRFTDEALDQLQVELDELQRDVNEQFWAVVGLGGLALLIRRRDDPRAATRLEQLIRAQRDRHPVLEAAILSLPQERFDAAQARAQQNLGRQAASKQAPLHGAAAPTGTTRLKDLEPVRRGRFGARRPG